MGKILSVPTYKDIKSYQIAYCYTRTLKGSYRKTCYIQSSKDLNDSSWFCQICKPEHSDRNFVTTVKKCILNKFYDQWKYTSIRKIIYIFHTHKPEQIDDQKTCLAGNVIGRPLRGIKIMPLANLYILKGNMLKMVNMEIKMKQLNFLFFTIF